MFSFPVAITAVTWIAFIAIAFILPQINVRLVPLSVVRTPLTPSFFFQPVDSQTVNYAIVAVGIVIIYSVGFWLLSARKWFTGPVKQIAGASFRHLAFRGDCI